MTVFTRGMAAKASSLLLLWLLASAPALGQDGKAAEPERTAPPPAAEGASPSKPDAPPKAEPADDWVVSTNYWYESEGSKRDLQEYFTVISKGELDIFVEQMQTSKTHFQRLRVHYKDFYLHKSDNAVVVFRPGFIVDTLGDSQIGGRLTIRIPKAKLSIVHNGYAGNRFDRHQTFVEVRPHKNLGVLFYQLADKRGRPTTLLGPKLYLGKSVYMYYGMPLNTNKRTLMWIGGKFSF